MKKIYRRRGRKSESADSEKELQSSNRVQKRKERDPKKKEEREDMIYHKEGECEDMEPAKARQMGKR